MGYGAGDGERFTLNVQPVVPVTLNEDWNIISRTIVPIIHQDDVIAGDSSSGLGDTTQSLFFSPKKPTSSGWIWGVGPALLLPTATEDDWHRSVGDRADDRRAEADRGWLDLRRVVELPRVGCGGR